MTIEDFDKKYQCYVEDSCGTELYDYNGYYININEKFDADNPNKCKYSLLLDRSVYSDDNISTLEMKLYEEWYLSECNNYEYPTEFDLNNCCDHQRYFSEDCEECEEPNSKTIKVLEEINSCLQSDIFNADETNAEFSNSKMQIEIDNAIKLITERKR